MPFRSIDDPAKLRRVLEVTLLLDGALDLPGLLRHIVEEARSMTDARYAALGVLTEDGTSLAQFLTVGLDPEEEDRIGDRPTGKGVLGLLITDPRPIEIADLQQHEASFGFPPNHPPMTSFLGVPVMVRGEVYGNLYLTDKVGASEFTDDDEALIVTLAVAAGIAVENARLQARVQEAAVYEERDRLARDLHDTVIQRLFAIGLSLQSVASDPAVSQHADRLAAIVADVDDTIRQVRSSIFELGLRGGGQGLREKVIALVRELRPVVGFDIPATFDGPVDAAVPDAVGEDLLAVIREAITNIGRHARASAATVAIDVAEHRCRLRVRDDGCGITGADPTSGGLGLVNIRQRAERHHGHFTVECPEGGGTVLTWQVPLDP